MAQQGLSPRVRGNPRHALPSQTTVGSIPACAGEPPAFRLLPPLGRVYPRVCGGTFVRPAGRARAEGLSPRVRGNPDSILPGGIVSGSIPACAGEPCRRRGRRPRSWVYPRVCGGTSSASTVSARSWGLSPRVRGNRVRQRDRPGPHGSIPACAGEPDFVYCFNDGGGVYPRVCGGTLRDIRGLLPMWGLSPRVRGNPCRRRRCPCRHGSIPACAGEPCRRHQWPTTLRVYPRVCGGTLPSSFWWLADKGLSPRVRGNLLQRVALERQRGSIPACAGEPPRPSRRPPAGRVYPRVCGGTFATSVLERTFAGLSPRVRGNLRRRRADRRPAGSIPACAGEPARPLTTAN